MRRAFTWHWNLMGIGAGVAFGFLSGKPDIILPIVGAVELAYMGFVGTSSRFQKVLVGKEMLDDKPPPLPVESKLNRLLSQLDGEDISRFEGLRDRIRKLVLLRRRVESSDPEYVGGSSSFRIESLDRLLWLFLKLLHQRHALDQFTAVTDHDHLVREAAFTETELEEARTTSQNPRLLRSLEEKLDTIQQRIENYVTSEENLRIVEIELDKTEQKINHICELGMTNADGIDLTSQIEALTDNLESNERSMQDLAISSPFEQDQGPRPVLLELDDVSRVNRVEYE